MTPPVPRIESLKLYRDNLVKLIDSGYYHTLEDCMNMFSGKAEAVKEITPQMKKALLFELAAVDKLIKVSKWKRR